MDDGKRIGYIEKGIVIDHVPYGEIWKIVDLLGINKLKNGRVSLGDGYESSKIGKKGILKIEGMNLSRKQLNLIALIADDITISLIDMGKVKEKPPVKIPSILENIIRCPNSECISNNTYEPINPIINYDSNKVFSCHYCKRTFDKTELKFIY